MELKQVKQAIMQQSIVRIKIKTMSFMLVDVLKIFMKIESNMTENYMTKTQIVLFMCN